MSRDSAKDTPRAAILGGGWAGFAAALTLTRSGWHITLHEAARERGCHFIDAPVSGGQAGTEQGILTIMCGGDPEAFQRAVWQDGQGRATGPRGRGRSGWCGVNRRRGPPDPWGPAAALDRTAPG